MQDITSLKIRRLVLTLFCFFYITSNLFSANNFSEFNNYINNGDLKNAKKIIDNWGGNKLKDPQYYICQFNYYVNKGRTSGIALQSEKPDTRQTFVITDPKTGKTVAYLGPHVFYDKKVVNEGIKYIKKGIKLFPDHFEMRFGLLWCYMQLYQLNDYLVQLEESLKYYRNNKNKKIYWNNNEIIENPEKFLIETIQGNFANILQNKTIAGVKEFVHHYCDIMIKYFPEEKYGYSNKGVLFLYSKEYKKGLEWLFKAHKKDNTDEIIILNIAFVYKDTGDIVNAKQFFNKIIKTSKKKSYIKIAKEELHSLEKK